ncbi:hypothetical protein BDV93DRAFT_547241 [Ceratobasidium sp. AG-I]|nr:hypothetical protein BDV93DRAFT_547241 [Ceratobasidium sp. AG-I]
MSPNYDAHQQVFALSLAANVIRNCPGTCEDLQKELYETLPALTDRYVGADWYPVWGPVVWKHRGATPDHPPGLTWFVMVNPSLKFDDDTTCRTYVVVIAATTGETIDSYDWRYDDLATGDTFKLHDWFYGPGGIKNEPEPASKVPFQYDEVIANGIAQGVHTLANTPPAENGQSSLADWLKKLEPPTGSRLIFTGHGLGGALSPTLAVMLSKLKYLGQFGPGNVLVYPTAGLSPGNFHFARLFKETFPPIGTAGTYKVWNQNVVNSLDIVPHAWCTDRSEDLNLHSTSTIYDTHPSLEFRVLFWAAVKKLCWLADSSWVAYSPLSNSPFSGEMSSERPEGVDAEFVNSVEKQHTEAYYKFILGTTDVPELWGSPTDENRFISYPVIGGIYPQIMSTETKKEIASLRRFLN